MLYIVEQRRPKSPLQLVKNWSEVAGSKSDTPELIQLELDRLAEYDVYYCLSGWEYRIREVKK